MADAPVLDAPPAKSGKKRIFIIAGALVVLLGGGGGAAWYFLQGGEHSEQAEAEPPKAPVFMPLDTFTVNLQGGEQYLQTDITLQVADEIEVETLKLYMPRIRSRLLTLLSTKHAEDLTSETSKETLAREILAAVNLPLVAKGKPQQVSDVLFTSFVIQ
jgi:flagellar FliL protein